MFKKSIYIHGEGASHLSGKSKSFQELFGTISIPWEIDPFDAVKYYEENLITNRDIIIIASSAGAISAIEIERKFKNVSKMILLNPAIHIPTLHTLCETHIYLGSGDGGKGGVYNQNENIKIIEIDGDHSFRGKEKELNDIIEKELKIN